MNQTVVMPMQPTPTPTELGARGPRLLGADSASVPTSNCSRADPRTSTMPTDSATRLRGIVDAHFAFIWRSLRGLGVPSQSADDAAQHVFWIAAQKLDAIAIGRERAFLFSTALGVAANARRARARTREVVDEQALSAQPDDSPNAEDLLQMKQARARLDQVLERMPDDLRAVFVLFVLEGTTAPDIAELLGLAPGTVASRLRRAREAFHEIAKRIEAQSEGQSARRSQGGRP
jgi:RNA polymerase sigma-70 factor (ECF subfamily)